MKPSQPFDPILIWERKLSGRKCDPVDFSQLSGALPNIVDRLKATMHYCQGQGLAAPQIGLFLQAAIAAYETELLVLFNPTILDSKGEAIDWEGCLSLPGGNGHLQQVVNKVRVARSRWIKISFRDINGYAVEREFEGHFARVVQHEIDHLAGVFIIDRVGSLFRDSAIAKTKKYVKGVECGRIE